MEEKIEPNSVVNKENLELLICEICKGTQSLNLIHQKI